MGLVGVRISRPTNLERGVGVRISRPTVSILNLIHHGYVRGARFVAPISRSSFIMLSRGPWLSRPAGSVPRCGGGRLKGLIAVLAEAFSMFGGYVVGEGWRASRSSLRGGWVRCSRVQFVQVAACTGWELLPSGGWLGPPPLDRAALESSSPACVARRNGGSAMGAGL